MIIVRAPMRISIGGGGTDLPSYYSKFGGEWTSAAIDKYVYITVHKRFDDTIRVCYSKTENVNKPEEIQHPIVREALKLLGIDGGIEIFSAADIPSNTGLGSSGSFTVALLTALHTYLQDVKKEDSRTKTEIAEQAFHIAIDLLKEPSGKQDEYIAAHGGLTSFSVSPEGKVKVEPLYINKISPEVMSELEHNLLMFYTGIRRESSQVLRNQAKATEQGEKDMIENLNRVKEIGREIKEALEKGNLTRFGELLDIHWQEKIKRKGTSDPRINGWYETAKEAGAIGGKLMGAGGGGFFLFYCENQKEKLRKAMASQGLRETAFRFDFEGAKVVANFI
jgi:D-glycero-alpha-D-manno-heptose-7-phosphate kinase